MSLPVKPLATDFVEIDGQRVNFHSLSRADCYKFTDMKGDVDRAEVFLLTRALDVTEPEILDFRAANDLETVGQIVDKVVVMSGLATQAQVDAANARRKGELVQATEKELLANPS